MKRSVYLLLGILIQVGCSAQSPLTVAECFAWESDDSISSNVEKEMFLYYQSTSELTFQSNKMGTEILFLPSYIAHFSRRSASHENKIMSVFQVFEASSDFDDRVLSELVPKVRHHAKNAINCESARGMFIPRIYP